MKAKTYLPFFILLFLNALALVACAPVAGQPGDSPGLLTPLAGTPAANLRGLAIVDSLDVQIMESFPVQVSVVSRGSLPDTCITIADTELFRRDRVFTISIFTTRPSGVVCAQETRPFEVITPLDITGLEGGTYSVESNGASVLFDLPSAAATETPVISGRITGNIWHDLCAVSGGEGGTPLVPGPGCIAVNNGYRANGQRDADERGLAGVQVQLGQGACPASGLHTVRSNPDGAFVFLDLLPGMYCLSIEPADSINAAVLLPGEWTFPNEAIDQTVAFTTITLNESHSQQDASFGWDYQFLPVPPSAPTPAPTATATSVPPPCDSAKFVTDVTIPDNTPFSPGTTFTKTWRITNNGTCTWTQDYDLVFVNGNAMTDQVVHALTKTVRPGESIDLSVKMTVPNTPGTFKGSWMLRNAQGQLFGLGTSVDKPFWVLIKVITPNTNYTYDFAANFCLAKWSNEDRTLSCPSVIGGEDGFVMLLDRPVLENRNEDEPALWVRPNHEKDGWIRGEFPPVIVQNGDHFKAWVGCLDDSNGCDMTFTLSFKADGGPEKELGQWTELYDGAITKIDIDLSDLARRSVVFILKAEINNKNFDSANGFWFAPRIENKKTPPANSSAVLAAQQMIASYLAIQPESLNLVSKEGPLTWNDSCLEVVIPGIICTEAQIQGYRLVFEYRGLSFEAHTDLNGLIVYWFLQ